MSLTKKWLSEVSCPKWTDTSCHKQTKDAASESIWREYVHKKNYVHALSATLPCSFLCAIYLFFEEASSIW